MAFEEKIIQQSKWSQEAETGLSIALDGETDFFKHQINTHQAQLYKIGEKTWCILRTEFEAHKKILVLCCLQGKNGIELCRHLICLAKTQGFDEMRIHSKRPGIGRWLKNIFNFYIAEVSQCEKIYKLKV